MMMVSVPGNLLLIGEYAITLVGAVAVAAAVEPRVRARATRGTGGISGTMGSACYTAAPGSLLGAVVAECGAAAGWQVEVDSTAFSGARGKLGMGSSAAVAVAVTALLLRLQGNASPATRDVITAATRAHRVWQSGCGSGYDVATSALGGIVGLSRNGELTAAQVAMPAPELALIHGEAALSTPVALDAFVTWQTQHPLQASQFLRRSRTLANRFLHGDAAQRFRVVAQSAPLVRRLGDKIGITVEPEALRRGLDRVRRLGWAAKAAGAGGELGLAVPPPGGASDGHVERVQVASEGLRWEP